MLWSGNQITKIHVTIKTSQSLQTVYSNEQETLKLEYTVPAGVLSNGTSYIVSAYVYYKNSLNVEETSEVSDSKTFKCLNTPIFRFENITDGCTIQNSNVNANIVYYQEQLDSLYMYKFYLYDSTKKVLSTSKDFYGSSASNYYYTDLENNKTYYARAIGTIDSGVEVDTGYIEFHILFENPESYSKIYATNYSDRGYTLIQSNLILIQPSDSTKEYTIENGFINLENDNVQYNSGYKVPNDFVLDIIIRDFFKQNENFIIMKDSSGKIICTLSSLLLDDKLYYVFKEYGIYTYMISTDEIVYDAEDDYVRLCLKVVNGIAQLQTVVEKDVVIDDYGDLYFKLSMPSAIATNDVWINTDSNTEVKIAKTDYKEVVQDTAPVSPDVNTIYLGGWTI